ncbi:8-amino-7-oxononanoate synthase [Aestuariispira insulae]|uniref:8-amino-7-oxononanoate synthase n=1 Tax=Aestuariispira insulae TaxID=1461337 RepID=A0A3D9HXD1_9PROT|nr:8-amino-7-oxononanoate synthase [Aestuariispira insulae]RED53556.1 8-amino-7-oxononanoate synthase [Aestuariispira insulae]
MADISPYRKTLQQLSTLERRRSLKPTAGFDFSSNDFLGLKNHPAVRMAVEHALSDGMDLGSGGSRLLRGNHKAFEALEQDAASFFGAGAALYMASGFMANFALFSTLPQRGDVILMDELIHASAKEGIRASFAKSSKIAHNDANAFEAEIKRWREKGAKNIWLAVESVYSMDGDKAPIAELMAIADQYGCFLVVDEAHATGIQGPNGRGLAEPFEGRENLISMHTCGKALGVSGALITMDATLCDFMVNASRAFIYTTAPSPVMAVAVREALALVDREPERRKELLALAAKAKSRLVDYLPPSKDGSQILPVILGTDEKAVKAADYMQAAGFDVRAVRPPTVPEGSARLRVSITLNIDEQILDAFCGKLADAL